MGQVIPFSRARCQLFAALNNYDIHFNDPSGRKVIWSISAPDEEAAQEKMLSIWGLGCEIKEIRCVGDSYALSREEEFQ